VVSGQAYARDSKNKFQNTLNKTGAPTCQQEIKVCYQLTVTVPRLVTCQATVCTIILS